jgi:hypothetical protein
LVVLLPKIYAILLRPFGFIAPNDFYIVWLSNLLALSVKPDEIRLYLQRRRKDMDVNERERLSNIQQIRFNI